MNDLKIFLHNYGGALAFVCFIVFLIVFFVYKADDWKPDVIINEKPAGLVSNIDATNGVLTSSTTDSFCYRITLDSGQTYILARNAKGCEIERGEKAYMCVATLDGGRSELHHYYLGVDVGNVRNYYLLAQ